MKSPTIIAAVRPQPDRLAAGRIHYEAIPWWTMAKLPAREQNRSRMIGHDWRDRLLNVKP